MDLTQLFNDAVHVFDTFRSAGLLAGLALLVNLLVNLTRVQFIAKYLADKTWARSLIALGLGSVGGVVASLMAGMPVGDIVLGGLNGLAAGLGAVGIHEAVGGAKRLMGKSQ